MHPLTVGSVAAVVDVAATCLQQANSLKEPHQRDLMEVAAAAVVVEA